LFASIAILELAPACEVVVAGIGLRRDVDEYSLVLVGLHQSWSINGAGCFGEGNAVLGENAFPELAVPTVRQRVE
jgi:hypothetical protein